MLVALPRSNNASRGFAEGTREPSVLSGQAHREPARVGKSTSPTIALT